MSLSLIYGILKTISNEGKICINLSVHTHEVYIIHHHKYINKKKDVYNHIVLYQKLHLYDYTQI